MMSTATTISFTSAKKILKWLENQYDFEKSQRFELKLLHNRKNDYIVSITHYSR